MPKKTKKPELPKINDKVLRALLDEVKSAKLEIASLVEKQSSADAELKKIRKLLVGTKLCRCCKKKASKKKSKKSSKNDDGAVTAKSNSNSNLKTELVSKLDAPRGGVSDDLKMISGVGPKLEETLHHLGVFHFDQIAAWTDDEVNWVDDYLSFPGRIVRENWIDQAKALARGGRDEYVKVFGKEPV